MTEQEQIMVQIVGMDEKIPLDDLHAVRSYSHEQLTRNGQQIEGPSHIQAIRHKKTGEVIVPSLYYSLASSTSLTVWDSSDDEMYTADSVVYQEHNWMRAFSHWLKQTSRESFDNYELVVIIMKENKVMPYRYGYTDIVDENGRSRSIYFAGIAGLPRSIYNDIDEIIVIQETFGKSNSNTYRVNKKAIRPKKAYAPKEV